LSADQPNGPDAGAATPPGGAPAATSHAGAPAAAPPADAPAVAPPADAPAATPSAGATAPADVPAAAPPGLLAQVADGLDHPVDRRFVALQRVVGWIGSAVLALVSLIGLAIVVAVMRLPVPLALAGLGAWAVLVGAVAALGHAWPALEHRRLSYRLDARGIEIRRGVLWREQIAVPRNRIQHTDVSQGPLERQFGLATLLVHTAGTEHARVSLPGLRHETALAIRDHLVAGGGDDAV
jgi:hypothetical protein